MRFWPRTGHCANWRLAAFELGLCCLRPGRGVGRILQEAAFILYKKLKRQPLLTATGFVRAPAAGKKLQDRGDGRS